MLQYGSCSQCLEVGSCRVASHILVKKEAERAQEAGVDYSPQRQCEHCLPTTSFTPKIIVSPNDTNRLGTKHLKHMSLWGHFTFSPQNRDSP